MSALYGLDGLSILAAIFGILVIAGKLLSAMIGGR